MLSASLVCAYLQALLTSSLLLLAVTRLKPHTCQAAAITPASPVIRRSSEPQLCPSSSNKPLPDPGHSTHSTPCHGYARASPSPSVNSYSDPDTGHYCQLHPTSPVSRERPAHDTKQLPAKSYVERLKVEEGQRGTVENGSGEAEAGQRLKGERDFAGFVPPTVETCSSFNPAAFQSLLIPLENKPLEMAVLKKVKELLADVDAKTLAKHITKVDCLVRRGQEGGTGTAALHLLQVNWETVPLSPGMPEHPCSQLCQPASAGRGWAGAKDCPRPLSSNHLSPFLPGCSDIGCNCRDAAAHGGELRHGAAHPAPWPPASARPAGTVWHHPAPLGCPSSAQGDITPPGVLLNPHAGAVAGEPPALCPHAEPCSASRPETGSTPCPS